MAIPVAKSMGLNVITNGSAENQERVMRLGADRFIDYQSEDYSKALSDVDYVLDTLGVRELEKEFRILKSGEVLFLCGDCQTVNLPPVWVCQP